MSKEEKKNALFFIIIYRGYRLDEGKLTYLYSTL